MVESERISILDDARAKLRRANLHTETLRADIHEAGQGEPYTIPLREDLDEDTGALYIRVDRDTARSETWGLLIGDAVHNFRSALDNGWWQLASHHLGREPAEKESTQIQFPILKPGGTWNHGSAKKWVGEAAAKFARELQPDPRACPQDVSHPLADLRTLSNVDKHRKIHPTVHMLAQLRLTPKPEGTDPKLLEGLTFTIHHFGSRAPKAGDNVLSTPRGFIRRYPKVKFDAHQSGFVAIEGRRKSVQDTLDGIAEFVDMTLVDFERILAGEKIPTFKLVVRPERI
jgi:hypothetical protein